MTTQLTLYNGALRALKERPLAGLTDPVKSRRELDNVWDSAIKACLEQGYWNFAVRTSVFTPDVGYTATFGYKNRFTIPTDFVRLVALCRDEFFQIPNNSYTEEAGKWFSDEATLYVSYISDDPNYGSNMARWSESFINYVELYLADQVAGVITGDADMVGEKKLYRALVNARSKDAMNEPTKFMPSGQFTRARRGGSGFDRRPRGQLIG
jgi:hypothetical protein